MLQHVWERASQARYLTSVVIADCSAELALNTLASRALTTRKTMIAAAIARM